jgi:hypothetical protein
MHYKHIVISFLLICSFSNAEVYTWINKDGGREYGDEPPANAQKADLPTLHTVSDQQVTKPPTSAVNTPDQTPKNTVPEFIGYNLLKILYPKEDDMIVASQAGTASIQLHISPPLQPGHEITLLLDGKKVAAGPQLSFEVKNIFRGSHLLQARIKDKGRLLISSPKRRIHVQRPSILNR